jgi:hypothetical protein
MMNDDAGLVLNWWYLSNEYVGILDAYFASISFTN